MIIVIDNFDSFTYNLVDILKVLGVKYKVINYIEEFANIQVTENISKIIISPGPSHPKNSQISLKSIEFAEKNKIPLLGICLGHQAIGYYFGTKVIKNVTPIHGKISKIEIVAPFSKIFQGLPPYFLATRYHSLVLENIVSPCLRVTAVTLENQLKHSSIMAIEHKILPIYGVQFHPESITSEFGFEIVKNFI